MLITVYRTIGIYFRLGFYSLNFLNKIKGHFLFKRVREKSIMYIVDWTYCVPLLS